MTSPMRRAVHACRSLSKSVRYCAGSRCVDAPIPSLASPPLSQMIQFCLVMLHLLALHSFPPRESIISSAVRHCSETLTAVSFPARQHAPALCAQIEAHREKLDLLSGSNHPLAPRVDEGEAPHQEEELYTPLSGPLDSDDDSYVPFG